MTKTAYEIAEDHGVMYSGDVDPFNYGGSILSTSEDEFKYGYLSAARITPMDDLPVVLVEFRSIIIDLTGDEFRRAMEYCDAWQHYREAPNGEARRAVIAEALLSYGYHDPDGDFCSPEMEVYWAGDEAPTPEEIATLKCASLWPLSGGVKREHVQDEIFDAACSRIAS